MRASYTGCSLKKVQTRSYSVTSGSDSKNGSLAVR